MEVSWNGGIVEDSMCIAEQDSNKIIDTDWLQEEPHILREIQIRKYLDNLTKPPFDCLSTLAHLRVEGFLERRDVETAIWGYQMTLNPICRITIYDKWGPLGVVGVLVKYCCNSTLLV